MVHRIQNEASKNKVQYISGKPKKDKAEDFIYLDIELWNMVSILGADETIQYLQNKVKQIKQTSKKK